jgi:probable phosphoglycerate mutase
MFILTALAFLLPIQTSAEKIKAPLATDNFSSIFTFELDQFQELEMSDASLQRIYIIRHGESEFNKPNAQGVRMTSGKSLSAKLTPLGEKQAIALGKKLADKINATEKICILSSTALRAQETARLVFEKLKETHLGVELGESYEGLCELGLGEWEGKPKDALFEEAMRPWESLSQAEKFTANKVEGGESFKDVAQRALRELYRISRENPDKTIFVVSHFHTMNAIALELSGQAQVLSETECTNLPFLILDNCDLLKLEIPLEGKEEAFITMHIQSKV